MIPMNTLRFFLFFCFLSFISNAQDFIETATLTGQPRTKGQFFGQSVSISGDYAIVGAYKDETDVNNENPLQKAGAAFIFEKENGTWQFKQKLVQEERWFGDDFGKSVSIEGNYAIVGIDQEDLDDDASQYGAALIYKRDNDGVWQEHQLLSVANSVGDKFGFPVLIKEGTIIVGSIADDTVIGADYYPNTGSVYVFEKDPETDQWQEMQKLVASDAEEFDQFGKDIDIYENTIIVGANLEGNEWEGAAYVFEKDNTGIWNEIQRLEASDRDSKNNPRSQFGDDVAIDRDYIFIGAGGHDVDADSEPGQDEEGAVYVFKKNGNAVWEEVQYLTLENSTPWDKFGESVNVVNNVAVISANEFRTVNDPFMGRGACFVYQLNPVNSQWELTQTLSPTNNYMGKQFGVQAVFDGQNIIVGDFRDYGADRNDYSLEDSGVAHIFELPETLSTQNYTKASAIVKLYPNPVTDHIYLHTTAIKEPVSISIKDLMGKLVYQADNVQLQEYRIALALAAGTYAVQVKTKNTIETLKFVKQ